MTAGSLTHTSSHGGTNGTGGSKSSSVAGMSKNSRSPPQKAQFTQSKKIPIPKTGERALLKTPNEASGRRIAGQISASGTAKATMSRLSS